MPALRYHAGKARVDDEAASQRIRGTARALRLGQRRLGFAQLAIRVLDLLSCRNTTFEQTRNARRCGLRVLDPRFSLFDAGAARCGASRQRRDFEAHQNVAWAHAIAFRSGQFDNASRFRSSDDAARLPAAR